MSPRKFLSAEDVDQALDRYYETGGEPLPLMMIIGAEALLLVMEREARFSPSEDFSFVAANI